MYCPSPALMLLLLRVLLLLVYRRRAAVGVARGESRWWCSRGLGRRPIDDAMKSAAVVLGRRMQCVASASACLPVCVEVVSFNGPFLSRPLLLEDSAWG